MLLLQFILDGCSDLWVSNYFIELFIKGMGLGCFVIEEISQQSDEL